MSGGSPDMGKAKQYRPERLAEKLLYIRNSLNSGLSQDDMVSRLGMPDELNRNYISCFERSTRVPPLNVLLAYSRLISITGGGEFLEALIDDEMDLPEILPADPRIDKVRRRAPSRGKPRSRSDTLK
jgi:transcriptional regulator with XRE-family HTH domain